MIAKGVSGSDYLLHRLNIRHASMLRLDITSPRSSYRITLEIVGILQFVQEVV